MSGGNGTPKFKFPVNHLKGFGPKREDIINNEKRLTHDYFHPWSEIKFSRDVSDLCLVGINIDPEIANRMLRCVYESDYKNLRKIEVINGEDKIIYKKEGGIDNPEHLAYVNLINKMKGLPMENNDTDPDWNRGMWGDEASNDDDSEEDYEENEEGDEDDEDDEDSTGTEEEDPELWNFAGMGRRLDMLLAGDDNVNDDEIVENNE